MSIPGLMADVITIAVSKQLPARDNLPFLNAVTNARINFRLDLSRACWQFLERELILLPSQPIELRNHIEQIRAGISALANGRQFPDATEQAGAVPDTSEDQEPSSRHAMLAAFWAAVAAGTADLEPKRCIAAIDNCLINARYARSAAGTPPWGIGLDSEAKSQAIRWLALLLDNPAA